MTRSVPSSSPQATLVSPPTEPSGLDDSALFDDESTSHYAVPLSETLPRLDRFPTLLRLETLRRLYECFEEELGCEFECHRAIAALGGSRDTFPRRLAGPLLIALSQKLHPERRAAFLRDACRALHEYEGTPRVLV